MSAIPERMQEINVSGRFRGPTCQTSDTHEKEWCASALMHRRDAISGITREGNTRLTRGKPRARKIVRHPTRTGRISKHHRAPRPSSLSPSQLKVRADALAAHSDM